MKHLLLTIAALSLFACSDNDSNSETAKKDSNGSTDLRDWAKSQTSRAELTTALAEARMALRLIEQAEPLGAEAQELKTRIETLEKELKELENDARQ